MSRRPVRAARLIAANAARRCTARAATSSSGPYYIPSYSMAALGRDGRPVVHGCRVLHLAPLLVPLFCSFRDGRVRPHRYVSRGFLLQVPRTFAAGRALIATDDTFSSC